MTEETNKKCAHHTMSVRDVADGKEYCGEACRDAGSDDVEIACQCDHLQCPLVV